MKKKKLVDIKEATEIFGYRSTQSIWLLKKAGKLNPVNTPEAKLYFLESQVKALKKNQEKLKVRKNKEKELHAKRIKKEGLESIKFKKAS